MKILVVGATGALGRPVVQLLRAKGLAVRALNRHPAQAADLAEIGAEVVAGDLATQEPVGGLGPDADRLDPAALTGILRSHPMRLHGFLRDQHALAGVGRRLANEICHRAGLSPFAGTAKLTDDQVGRLAAAMGAVIAESLVEERPTCGDTVRTVAYRAYTVAYCPTCQTGGKVLADNTTSKFLK